ncbi:MAG: DUF3316 domain-containing protein [Bacteroidaceae bacterium]|nr:DUF3316 domain-containing protein [Bacteroidaceae bacterium]
MRIKINIIIIVCLVITVITHAQEPLVNNQSFNENNPEFNQEKLNGKQGSSMVNRVYTRATSYGIGLTSLQDTYLSPENYKGWEARLSRETMHQTHLIQGKVWQQTYFQGNFGYTNNRVENNKTATALANWNYGWFYRQPLTPRFDVLLGGAADLNGGFTYNMRNGNNPVSIRAYGSIDASVIALWNLELNQRPLLLRYQANLPLIGLMFMPHYGQSYYEIFSVGEHGGTIKCVTPFSTPSLRQMFSADYPFGKLTLRFTYVWDAQQANLNQIKSHIYSHIFMIGVVKRFQRL